MADPTDDEGTEVDTDPDAAAEADSVNDAEPDDLTTDPEAEVPEAAVSEAATTTPRGTRTSRAGGAPSKPTKRRAPGADAKAEVAARREATKARMDEAKSKGGDTTAKAAKDSGKAKGGKTTAAKATADDPTGSKARRRAKPTSGVARPSKRTGGTPDAKASARAAARSGNPKKAAAAAEDSARSTAPIPRNQLESPTWVPVLMFVFLGVGSLLILLTYVVWDARPLTLGIGLAFILTGILIATQYR